MSGGAAPALQLFNLLWLPQTLLGSNGALLSTLLALSLIAPLLLWKNHKAFAMIVAFLGTAVFYGAVGATRESFVSRALAPSYPFWAMGAGVVLSWLVERLPKFKQIALSGVVVVLGLSIISTGFYIREFTQTLHPQVEAWVLQAAKEGRPIRHVGNPWLALFFAQANHVEAVKQVLRPLVGDPRQVHGDLAQRLELIGEARLDRESLDRLHRVDPTAR